MNWPLFERLGLWVFIALMFYALERDLYAGDWSGAGVALLALVLYYPSAGTPQERSL